jgi:hypothetical protein
VHDVAAAVFTLYHKVISHRKATRRALSIASGNQDRMIGFLPPFMPALV